MTITDIAKLAGVSTGTVSNTINHTGKVASDTEKRIWEIIEKVNYIPNSFARGLKSNNSKRIFVIAEDIRAYPSPHIIDGISEYCNEAEYNLILFNLRIHPMIRDFKYDDYISSDNFKKGLSSAVQQAKSANACAIIYISIYPRNIEKIFTNMEIPVIFCYSYSYGDNYCINCNDSQGGKLATDYLISMGHKKIALICGVFDSLPTHKRLQGYQTALMDNQIPYVPHYIVAGTSWSFSDGYNLCNHLLRLPDPPTAIFVMSDVMAVGAIHAAEESGYKVPDDLSIHGYDNIENLDLFRPKLTTIAMPLHAIGRKSVQVVIDLLNKNEPKSNSILVDCEHRVQNSVKRLN